MKFNKLKTMAVVSAFALMMAFNTGTAQAQSTVDVDLDVETLSIAITPTAMDLGTWVILWNAAAASPADDFIIRTTVAGTSALAPASTLNNGNVWVQNDAASVAAGTITVDVTPDTGNTYNLNMDITGCTDFGDANLTIDPADGAAPLRFQATAGTIGGGATSNQDFCDVNPVTVAVVTDATGQLVLNAGLDVVVSGQPATGAHTASYDVDFAF